MMKELEHLSYEEKLRSLQPGEKAQEDLEITQGKVQRRHPDLGTNRNPGGSF